jgi:zinc D-Ala-D-Ala carboxypeptidase
MIKTFRHWKIVSREQWSWPNFSPAEIACRGTGQLVIDTDAMDALQRLREKVGKPIIITSAYRSPEHNRRVKGATNSRHLRGDAFDISMSNHDPNTFENAARAEGFTGFGFYPKSNFMHIDMGQVRTWGTRFPRSEPMFSEEPKLVEDLSSSRTMVGSGGAAVGGVAVIGQAVAEIEKAESSFSVGGIFGMVIGTLILVGACVALYARWDDAGRPLPWRRY